MVVAQKIEAAALTDLGRVRQCNQDAFGSDDELGLYVVCDGMGGAAGGEVASRIAVDTFLAIARQEIENLHDANRECTRCALERAAAAANRAVLARAAFDIALRGMGSTLVAARLNGESLTILNVGDSRAYLFEQGSTQQLAGKQLTVDHSYVAEQVRLGLMTPDQAERSSLQSVITRAIGADADVIPDIFEATLHPGDTLLLASDGLTRHVELDDLTRTVAECAAEPATVACQHLIDLANARGGHDNITCLLLRAQAA